MNLEGNKICFLFIFSGLFGFFVPDMIFLFLSVLKDFLFIFCLFEFSKRCFRV